MKNDKDEHSVAAHGVGAGLAAVLAMFARSADDVARIGFNSIDDVGRACVTSTDDVGRLMSRNSDDLFRVSNHVDDLRVDPTPARTWVYEADESVSMASHAATKAAEATFRALARPDRENDE